MFFCSNTKRPQRSTRVRSSAASDVYNTQTYTIIPLTSTPHTHTPTPTLTPTRTAEATGIGAVSQATPFTLEVGAEPSGWLKMFDVQLIAQRYDGGSGGGGGGGGNGFIEAMLYAKTEGPDKTWCV